MKEVIFNDDMGNGPILEPEDHAVIDAKKANRQSRKECQQDNSDRIWFIIIALMLSMLMSALGQMIFTTALPTIVGELGGVAHMSWVITAFLLGQTIALPIFGKLGDQLNKKPVFIAANALFIAASIVGATAQSMGVLIAGRATQGVAAGAMMILSQAIMAEVTTPRERGKYMGVMGSVFGLASILGPLAGGWFTDGPGWRWGMWLNLPLGIITIIAIMVFLRLPSKPQTFRVDWLGTITMSISTAALVLFVTWGGRDYEWSSPVILGLIATTIIFAILFVLIELKVKDPLISMELFKNRNFVLTTVAGLAVGIMMFGALAYLPTYLQMVHRLSPTNAGLMMIPMMGGMIVTSTLVGNWVTRTGKYKIYPLVGQVIITIAMVLLSTLNAGDSLIKVGIFFAIFGIGLGSTMQILVLIVQNSFPITKVGTATGTNNFFRQVGGSLGSALVGSIFLSGLSSQVSQKLPQALAQAQQNGVDVSGLDPSSAVSNLTPGLVSKLPPVISDAIANAYNDALTPVFLMLAPVSVIAVIMLFLVTENELRNTK